MWAGAWGLSWWLSLNRQARQVVRLLISHDCTLISKWHMLHGLCTMLYKRRQESMQPVVLHLHASAYLWLESTLRDLSEPTCHHQQQVADYGLLAPLHK